MITKVKNIIYILAIGLLSARKLCAQEKISAKIEEKPTPVIFETDMGNDVDDALALDMLYKYADQGKIKLLAISNDKNSPFSVPFLDILNNWYGYPDIPLGSVKNGVDSEGDSHNYAKSVCEYKVNGVSPFHHTIKDYSTIEESTHLYRKILSQQPDSSVTIISVGFSTNLARLLNTSSDKYSKLNGIDLVARKVKLLTVMAGDFEGNKTKEYNIIKDPEAARKVFDEWPGKIVLSPFEVGRKIYYPATSILNDFTWAYYHPVILAYKSYLKMPYDRPTWDLTAVLYAVEGDSNNYFGLSGNGVVSVGVDSITYFKNVPGKHAYLKINEEQTERIKARFIELISGRPKKYK